MTQNQVFGSSAFALGPFIKCPQPEIIEALSCAGFDFGVVDMEHTPLGPRDLYPLKLASEARKFDLIVRIPMNLEMYYKWCLDLGFKYIQVPFVQSQADAEQAISLSHFSPRGERGLCRFVRAADFSAKDKSEYISQAHENTKIILQIEGEKGAQNIDAILTVPGIFAIFIGPYDLSQSLGLAGQIWHPQVVSRMHEIVQKCKSAGIKIGTFTDTVEGIQHWAKEKIDFIEYGSDLNLLMSACHNLVSPFK